MLLRKWFAWPGSRGVTWAVAMVAVYGLLLPPKDPENGFLMMGMTMIVVLFMLGSAWREVLGARARE